jgi:hypothetical protein
MEDGYMVRRAGGAALGALAGLLCLMAASARGGHGAAVACAGDCDGSGDVTVDEVGVTVNVALGDVDVSACTAGDTDFSGAITVDEIIAAVNSALNGCPPEPTPTPTAIPEEPCADRNPLRNLYFGDLHVHTAYSFDAYLWETRTTPADAYRFARGAALSLPPLDANGDGTRRVQLDRPLDFAAVTDHSEFLGEVETCITPGSATYDSPSCQKFRTSWSAAYGTFGVRLTRLRPQRLLDVCGAGNQVCLSAAAPVWARVQEAAAAAYDHCRFTSFVAYEYSRSPGGSTMHRNVIFRNERVPFPTSAFEQASPLGLWQELQHTCRDAGTGCDVLAIPHNSNESNGRTFFVEYPGAQTIDDERAQAQLRVATEPLVEIYQHKGDSECRNGLSGIVGAPDEQCDFEKRRPGPVPDCRNGVGQLGAVDLGCVSRLDYVRGALLAGLQEGARLGVNPYRLGFVGSTDTHNGIAGATDERTFAGHQGTEDDSAALRLANITYSPGALAGVWAEENARSSIFDALRRRETFATSGTRITVRAFGGWDFPADLCSQPDLARIGYERGTPMGGMLAPQPADAGAPVFVISALRDPGTAAQPGTQLQRLQVIKGWIVDGAAHQQVYDVAGDAHNGADVDLATCTPRGQGANALCTVWTDPDFNPAVEAFYYVRVLENPTCRWSTWLCNQLSEAERPAACDDPAVPKTIQERAWTSPVWYEPAR